MNLKTKSVDFGSRTTHSENSLKPKKKTIGEFMDGLKDLQR